VCATTVPVMRQAYRVAHAAGVQELWCTVLPLRPMMEILVRLFCRRLHTGNERKSGAQALTRPLEEAEST
jgi:hypothetical protein